MSNSHRDDPRLSQGKDASPSQPSQPSGFQEIQQEVDKLNNNSMKRPIYKKAYHKGMDIAISAHETVTTGSTMLDQGVAVVSKVMESSETTKEVLSNIGKNPALSQLIQLADKLVDIGKSVPFIAPAFIILKVSITARRPQAVRSDVKNVPQPTRF